MASVTAAAGGMAALYLFATAAVFPAMEPRKSARGFALEVKRSTAASRAAGHDVVAWQAGNVTNGIAFYSDGVYTVETDDAEVLAAHLRQDALVYAVGRRSELDELPVDVLDGLRFHAERRLSRKDLALISNRGPA